MFVFEDKEVNTVGELLDAAVESMRNGKAAEFLAAYRAVNEHANANLGYVIGYCSDPLRSDLYKAYGVQHPIFGAMD